MSVRPSPVIFKRILGASCAVYPALLLKVVYPDFLVRYSITVLLFICFLFKVVYPDFLVRYSIVAPKIFADGGADNKATANKALLSVGMDPENFRTGHTKVIDLFVDLFLT